MQGHPGVRELHLHIHLSRSIFPVPPTRLCMTLYTVGVRPSSAKLHFCKVNMEKDLQGCCLEIDSRTRAGKRTCRVQSRPPKRWLTPKGLPRCSCSSLSVSFVVPVTELIKMQPFSNPIMEHIKLRSYLPVPIDTGHPAWLRRGWVLLGCPPPHILALHISGRESKERVKDALTLCPPPGPPHSQLLFQERTMELLDSQEAMMC